MFEKDGVVYENENEYELNSEEHLKQRKKKKVRIIIILILLLIFILFCHSCYRALIPVDYRIFTDKRTEFLEEKYMMDFSDVKLERYWTVSIAQDHDANLNFSEVEDFKAFMENNFNGEIISSLYEGKILEDGAVVNYGESGLVGEYKCRAGEISFNINFYNDGDSYRAEMVSYYVVGG